MSARIPIGVSVASGATVVVCDDGAVFTWVANSLEGWQESPPIPGSAVDLLQKRDAYYDRLREAFPSLDYAAILRTLRGRFSETEEAIAELASWVDDQPEGGHGYNQPLTLALDVLKREGWPEFVMVNPNFK